MPSDNELTAATKAADEAESQTKREADWPATRDEESVRPHPSDRFGSHVKGEGEIK
jgi:hypothetical protein